jgi:hypothetical protein
MELLEGVSGVDGPFEPAASYLEDAAPASDVLEGRGGGVAGRELHADHVTWHEERK